LPKETTVAESPDRASNLEPYDYQADALAVSYFLPFKTFEALSHPLNLFYNNFY